MKRIIARDFDNAVKQKWDSSTCIIAQAAKRIRVVYEDGAPNSAALRNSSNACARIMNEFDALFMNPGDEKKPRLQKLRASLPITI